MLLSLCFAILIISSTMIVTSVNAVVQCVKGSSSLISIRENIGSNADDELLLEPLLLKAGLTVSRTGIEFSLSINPDKKKSLLRVSKESLFGSELGCSWWTPLLLVRGKVLERDLAPVAVSSHVTSSSTRFQKHTICNE